MNVPPPRLPSGVNLDTLRPEPSVEGYSTPGGYSWKAVKPIALAKCTSIAKLIAKDYAGQVGARRRVWAGGRGKGWPGGGGVAGRVCAAARAGFGPG